MTTRVTITSSKSNHQNVRVVVREPSSGHVHSQHVLTDGESVDVWVHSGSELLVTEVAK